MLLHVESLPFDLGHNLLSAAGGVLKPRIIDLAPVFRLDSRAPNSAAVKPLAGCQEPMISYTSTLHNFDEAVLVSAITSAHICTVHFLTDVIHAIQVSRLVCQRTQA